MHRTFVRHHSHPQSPCKMFIISSILLYITINLVQTAQTQVIGTRRDRLFNLTYYITRNSEHNHLAIEPETETVTPTASTPGLMQTLNETERRRISLMTFRSLKSGSAQPIDIKPTAPRKNWCKTKPLKQRVTEKGCITKVIKNRFCHGRCNSYFVPGAFDTRIEPDSELGSFKSCTICKPRKFKWISVTLHCPKLSPPLRVKEVMIVEKCSCMSHEH